MKQLICDLLYSNIKVTVQNVACIFSNGIFPTFGLRAVYIIEQFNTVT